MGRSCRSVVRRRVGRGVRGLLSTLRTSAPPRNWRDQSVPDLSRMVAEIGIALAACAGLTRDARAEVMSDGSLGASGALTGPDFRVSAGRGRLVGGNLFHSFRTFNLAQGAQY